MILFRSHVEPIPQATIPREPKTRIKIKFLIERVNDVFYEEARANEFTEPVVVFISADE